MATRKKDLEGTEMKKGKTSVFVTGKDFSTAKTVGEIKKEIYQEVPNSNVPVKRLYLEFQSVTKENLKLKRKIASLTPQKKVLSATWQIQSLFGIKIDKEFLTPKFVENLFKNADFEFYLNKEKTHIFSQKNELLELDFGKLKAISALDAFHELGIEVLEKAKESAYVKVK